jgi:hypothetical protein
VFTLQNLKALLGHMQAREVQQVTADLRQVQDEKQKLRGIVREQEAQLIKLQVRLQQICLL